MTGMADDDDLPPGADELYGLPLEEFVAERGALAKRLRADGDREGATRVAALRKPSVAAWTVNQLVRSRRADVAAFTEAAEALRAAQAALLEGRGSAAGLREAREAERAAVGRLLESARGLFPGGREPGGATLERVAATLHAAAADETVRDAVLTGRLLAEREASGFGDLEVALPRAPARPRKGSDPGRKAPARRAAANRRGSDPGRGAAEAAERERAERERAERERAERERAERERAERRAALQAALDAAVAVRERSEQALAAARAEEERLRAALEDLG
jgi:hypothetical protein